MSEFKRIMADVFQDVLKYDGRKPEPPYETECKHNEPPAECERCARYDELEAKIKSLEAQLRTANAQRDAAYGYGNDDGAPPWMR